jgi:hypothetical protein
MPNVLALGFLLGIAGAFGGGESQTGPCRIGG